MKPRKLNSRQELQLAIAQRNLGNGVWSFQRYHIHLSVYVFPV